MFNSPSQGTLFCLLFLKVLVSSTIYVFLADYLSFIITKTIWKNHKIHNKHNRDQCQVTFLTTFCRILFILACLIFKHRRKWVDSSILETLNLRPTLPERPWERDCTLGPLCAAYRPHLCLALDHCSHAPARFSSLMSMPFSFAVVCKMFYPRVAGFRLFRAGLCTWQNEYFILLKTNLLPSISGCWVVRFH